MKFLKYLGILLLILILAYLAACYFGPKNMNVEESQTLEVSAPYIFNLINNIEKWEEWNDWNLKDTGMVVTYTDKKEGVGAKSTWTQSSYGNGSQEIVESVENERLKTKLNFQGWEGDNFGIFNLAANGNNTNVTWTFDGTPIPFLMRGMMLSGKSSMKESYQQGLNNLEKLAKERAKGTYNGYQINEKNLKKKNFVMNRQEVKTANIQQFYATNLGQLFGKVQVAGVEIDGMPCGLFFRMDERDGMIDMAAAIPVKQAVSLPATNSYSINSRRSLQVDYRGSYHGVTEAHKAMGEYMKDRSLFQDDPIIEEYVTDPGTEPDPSKWLTRVTYYFSE
ncbi:MAG: GyrI-like domain-containing protein [Saprospiraceae bacterium]|nr:GyrI-like domain-containing protein [Saprospiraceae bacterium]